MQHALSSNTGPSQEATTPSSQVQSPRLTNPLAHAQNSFQRSVPEGHPLSLWLEQAKWHRSATPAEAFPFLWMDLVGFWFSASYALTNTGPTGSMRKLYGQWQRMIPSRRPARAMPFKEHLEDLRLRGVDGENKYVPFYVLKNNILDTLNMKRRAQPAA